MVLCSCNRYIPVSLLEVTPQLMQWRPPAYRGRNELETLLASESAADWVRISEMLLGPAPQGFTFAPKHKSNAYAVGADAVAQLAGAAAGTEAAVSAACDAAGEEQENG
jgi:tRNA-dihydrouridine synthase 3